jgi:hypothetical protein
VQQQGIGWRERETHSLWVDWNTISNGIGVYWLWGPGKLLHQWGLPPSISWVHISQKEFWSRKMDTYKT